MTKILITVLLIVLVVAGVYFAFTNRIPFLSQQTTQPLPVTQTSSVSVTDQDLDNDLTALDKDLAEIDSGESALTTDLQAL